MLNIQIIDYPTLVAFWLAFARMTAIFFQIPIFDNISVPGPVKILTVLVITFTFFPYISPEILRDISTVGVDNFWLLTIFNVLAGLAIGFFVKAIMFIYQSAGTVITQQIGFAALRYFDPSAGSRLGPFEKLIQWTILILIISSGALMPIFKGIIGSFASINITDWGGLAQSPAYCARLVKSIFLSGLMLASPLIFINVLIMTTLGIIARTVPQMNVLMVSFVINIGLGLLVFTSVSDEFFQVAYKMYTEKLGEWFQYIM